MSGISETVDQVKADGSCRTVVDTALGRCRDDQLNAVVRTCDERVARRIDAVDAALAQGDDLPLAGVPVVLKDNICLDGATTGACSKMLDSFRAPYAAGVVERLEAAGAIIVAQANMDEFAMGSSTATSVHGPCKNPIDHGRSPGGSSGGSAASVAGGLVPLALGSDTGGSIRQPASFCGCVGLKPTYGRVSRYGLIAFASSLDQIGPLTTSVADAGHALAAIAGHDPRDSTSVSEHAGSVDAIRAATTADGDLSGTRIGVLKFATDGIEPAVLQAVEQARTRLAERGATLVDVELPHKDHGVAVYYVLCTGEASSNLARYDGIHYGHRADAPDLVDIYTRSRSEGFGTEVKRRILLGTYVLSAGYYDAYYKKAQKVRQLIVNDYAAAFEQCDAILGPTSPTAAFGIDANLDDPLQMYLADLFTLGANLAGIPALSVPGGTDDQGLPVGVQLQAARWNEAALIRIGRALES